MRKKKSRALFLAIAGIAGVAGIAGILYFLRSEENRIGKKEVEQLKRVSDFVKTPGAEKYLPKTARKTGREYLMPSELAELLDRPVDAYLFPSRDKIIKKLDELNSLLIDTATGETHVVGVNYHKLARAMQGVPVGL